MPKTAEIEKDTFWELLFLLEELKAPKLLKEFLEDGGLSISDFHHFLESSHSFSLNLKIEDTNEGVMIFPLVWYQEYGDTLIDTDEKKNLVTNIQEAIDKSRVCQFILGDDSVNSFYPWRVMFLEGKLVCIVENTISRQLITVSLDEVKSVDVSDQVYQSIYSRLEVEDFIQAMKVVDGSDYRLILKIYADKEIEWPSELIHLYNPYTTINQYGDLIWAATVEKSQYLFEWLYSNRNKLEIIGPDDIKNEFIEFCKSKNRQAA